MRLVATEYLSLDGVFEEPGHWSGPFFNDEAGQFKLAELQASDALLLGRRTYEGFSAAWPNMKGSGEFGVKMNTMTKYVVSSILSAGSRGSPAISPALGERAALQCPDERQPDRSVSVHVASRRSREG